MIFEKFSTQLQDCVDIFEDCDRPKHDQDIFDELWPSIQYQKLTSYVNTLNITIQQNLTDYKSVLQNIATQVQIIVKTSNFKRNIS